MGPVSEGLNKGKHVINAFASADLFDDGRAHNGAVRDTGNGFGRFGRLDPEADDDGQVGLGFDPRNFGGDFGRLGLCRAGDAGD